MSLPTLTQIAQLQAWKRAENACFEEIWRKENPIPRGGKRHIELMKEIDALDRKLDRLVNQLGLTSEQYKRLVIEPCKQEPKA